MLLERQGVLDKKRTRQQPSEQPEVGQDETSSIARPPQEKPLTCMVYFFASQMSRHLRQAEGDDLTSTKSSYPQHRLDSLLDKVRVHAAFSPLVTRFETIPVEIPSHPSNRTRIGNELPRESVHDTVAIMKFRSKGAWQEWIATPEWVEFMEKTEQEGVFRRLPHVRCANSLRGLRDPIEILQT